MPGTSKCTENDLSDSTSELSNQCLGPVYTKRQCQCYDSSAMMRAQGSHSTWKNESTPGKPGNIMEF